MPLFQAVVLAVVQGLTEFLPISSSAHLVLFPWFAGWQEPGLAFNVALHIGTLFAVLIYFLRDWVQLTLAGFGIRASANMSSDELSWKRKLFWLLVIGTIPGAIVGILFEKTIEERFMQPIPIACALIGVGLLMWWVDSMAAQKRHMPELGLSDSLLVGSAQALALFPGVSRSGITITAGLSQRMTRETAARFSFLLSTPLIAGAAIKELPKLLHAQKAGTIDISLSTLFIAIAISGIVGYLVIGFLLRYLQTRTLKVFVVYRVALGILILLLVLFHLGHTR
jgi:undecaprenyl-diphosphatase